MSSTAMYTPMSVMRQEAILISLVKKIEKEIEFRKAHHIVPARATWRALRETLTDEEWVKLEQMVGSGVIKEYRGIHYPAYEIDYHALRKWEIFAKQRRR